MNTQPITIHRYTDAQLARFRNHAASVTVNELGEVEVHESTIITPKGDIKTNKLISVIPEASESISTINQSSHLFSDLTHFNIILTNACNLSCTYCYEQHNKDYGRFTVESLRTAWDWLLTINNQPHKMFQFFGGEPLIHKRLILDFMNSDPEHFQQMYENHKNQTMSICTNGLLLDHKFIDEYFSRPYTSALISLDTTRADIDHRQISQTDIDKLLSAIDYIPAEAKASRRVVIRCTLSQEAAPYMNEFIDKMYKLGIRQLIVHPLVLDSTQGFISWPNDSWEKLHTDIITNLDKYQDLQIKFSEGVGRKSESNCLVGSDMLAIDASGDFSGCYFFTNMKTDGTGHTILGNVFKDVVYTDRYTTFQNIYNEMFETEEQCKTCDYRSACYQCPAGNADTGPKLFRPDDMCQKIVKLYIDLQDDVNKKTFMREYQKTLNDAKTVGTDKYIASALMMLGKLHFENINLPLTHFLSLDLPNYRSVAEWFKQNLVTPIGVEEVSDCCDIVDLYTALSGTANLALTGAEADIFYLNAIGQIITSSAFKDRRGMI